MSFPQVSRVVAIGAGTGAGLFLAWQAADALLLVFGGLLFGVLLDSIASFFRQHLRLGRGVSLTLAAVLIVLLVVGTVAWSGYTLLQQWDDLTRTLTQQIQYLRGEFANLGLNPGQGSTDGERFDLAKFLLPDPSRIFGRAQSALTAALGVFGNALVVVLIGVFTAASPEIYGRGFLRLIPISKRQRVSEVLHESVEVLQHWLLGQLVAMALVGLTTWIVLWAIGMQAALVLSIQAALFNFIPYLGPFLGAIPIGLAALPQGTSMLAWALGLYVLVHTVEGYVITPMIQRRVADIPPVLALASLMIMGALFGAPGVAIATPLAAVLQVIVTRLYIEDALGDAEHAKFHDRQLGTGSRVP